MQGIAKVETIHIHPGNRCLGPTFPSNRCPITTKHGAIDSPDKVNS